MLYERWREIAREFRHEIALSDLPSARQWTFAELDAAAQESEGDSKIAFPSGVGAEFVLSILRAWRHGRVTCPIETNQKPPVLQNALDGIVHLKLTSATTGAAK